MDADNARHLVLKALNQQHAKWHVDGAFLTYEVAKIAVAALAEAGLLSDWSTDPRNPDAEYYRHGC